MQAQERDNAISEDESFRFYKTIGDIGFMRRKYRAAYAHWKKAEAFDATDHLLPGQLGKAELSGFREKRNASYTDLDTGNFL